MLELIRFNYPEGMIDTLDKLNYQVEFIINRAAAFNKEKFDGIIIQHLDKNDYKTFMLYQVVRVIALARNVKIYIDKKYRNIPWVDNDNVYFKFVSTFKIKKMLKNDKTKLKYDTICEDELDGIKLDLLNQPRIFMGFSTNMIEEIAVLLYSFKENR